jgi:TetR/AcrR family transcriptional regulator, transcriptional repressor for nem operon
VAAQSRARPPGKRERLVAAARQMLHEHGVEQTTLADIATAANVPLGNVYYYFKTKDTLVSAVIETYGETFATASMALDRRRTPQGRLKALVRTWTSSRERLTRHGCPVGSLCSELDKRDDELRTEAGAVLAQMLDWAERQFQAMGRPDARDLAVALVAAYEGVALLANTLQDPDLICREGRRLERWIDSLAGPGQ